MSTSPTSVEPARRPRRAKAKVAARRGQQLELPVRTWGGKREGAGRKPVGAKAGVPHRPQSELGRLLPVHVTLRMEREVYNLRSRRSFTVIAAAITASADRFDVGIVDFSVQGNHIHLMVEAPSRAALGRAIKGLSVRLARGLNKMMGRQGRVLADRYHAHVLRTPTEVARARAYIRDNARKHAAARGDVYSDGYVDRYSSAGAPEVRLARPRTWLLRQGWKRGSGGRLARW